MDGMDGMGEGVGLAGGECNPRETASPTHSKLRDQATLAKMNVKIKPGLSPSNQFSH